MRVSSLGEFGLIDKIKALCPLEPSVVKGIGDDAAVLPLDKSSYQLFTTDMLVERVHFTRQMAAGAVGHKALACNISDIAAMGGVPTAAVVSLGVPKNLEVAWIAELYCGMGQLAKGYGVSIVGGDTVRSSKLTINVALLGVVEKKFLVTRAGAKAHDRIFVSGPLGGSFKSGRHLTFTPRLDQARFLVKHFKPTAMMDISDGLGGDLNHILKASNVGARLNLKSIPRNAKVSLSQALSDGEDFELLFTLTPSSAKKLLRAQEESKAWYFHDIGEITANPKERIHAKGYTHL